MIRFECEHCRSAVHVQDTHAGGKGRCPACNAIVQIPALANRPGRDSLAALAAAADGQADKPEGYVPPPLPAQPQADEFQLVDLEASSDFETDTFPAITDEGDREESAPHGEADGGTGAAEPPPAGPPATRRRTLLWIIVIELIALAAVSAWLVCRWR